MSSSERSIVTYGKLYANSCIYCKCGSPTDVVYGLGSQRLTVYDYQDLLDRGWRRSGMALYKPELERSCCPQYSIRLRVNDFKPSKEQKRVLQKMQRFLNGDHASGTKSNGENSLSNTHGNTIESAMVVDRDATKIEQKKGQLKATARAEASDVDTFVTSLSNALNSSIRACIEAGALPCDLEVPSVVVRKVQPKLRERMKNLDGDLQYTSNVAFQLLAALKQNETFTKGKGITTIAELLLSKLPDSHDFKVQACKGHINFVSKEGTLSDKGIPNSLNPNSNTSDVSFVRTVVEKEKHTLEIHTNRSRFDPEEYALYKKHQAKAHQYRPEDLKQSLYRDTSDKGTPNSIDPNKNTSNVSYFQTVIEKKKHTLEIWTKRSTFDPEEYALYKKYQVKVHHDRPESVQESWYRKFLVNTPLVYIPPSSETPSCGFGSFHQQYIIDGKLVAVGVVDVLPACLSSKYLFWDPDFAFLALGKFSALKEIMWAQEARKRCPAMEFYYMGYYIHSCPKMRYKVAYSPSQLLCPVRYQWIPFDIVRPLFDNQPYICLSDHAGKSNADNEKQSHVGKNMETRDVSMDEAQSSESGMCHQRQLADINTVLLKRGNRLLRFEQLEVCQSIGRTDINRLAVNLQTYLHYVGLSLAGKMVCEV